MRTVQEILAAVHATGDIYFSRYGGLYCTGCERFYTEKELVDGKCPDHLTPPTFIEEENYFFRMSKYQAAPARRDLEAHPDLIRPERYRNEVLAMLRASRSATSASRGRRAGSTWGIELPFDDRYVTYVWFDALINYVSGLRGSSAGARSGHSGRRRITSSRRTS